MSKSDKMSHAIGNIDDRFLLEAMESCRRRKSHRGVRIFGAVAASICLLVGLAVWGLRSENGIFTVYAYESDEHLTIVCKAKKNILAAPSTQRQSVQDVLEQYFDQLYSTLLEESDADYSPNDFASINGYIVAKELVASRYTYHTLLGGIHEVDLKEVTIEELSNQDDHLEAAVYVTCAFSYGDNGETSLGENGETSMGILYRVTLEESGEQYKVTDLDNDDVITRMAKETALASMKAADATDPYPFIDAYFQQLKQNADDMLKTQEEMRKMEESETAEDTQRQEVQAVLEEFFDSFYSTLLEESDADYSPNDFASINGYIVAKDLVASRYTYHTLLGGIHEIDLKEVTIEELSDQGDYIEATVCAACVFSYGDDGKTSLGENGETSMGNLYRITLEKSGEQYKVTDLDNNAIEVRMAKEAVHASMKAAGATDPYPFIDAHFRQLKQNADDMLKASKEMRK